MLRVSRSTIAHNDQETTLLTHTTAMSCPSFSIPAGFTCPGASKHPDSPCAHCYACQGMYLLDTTARAQWIRYRWTRDCMKSAEGRMEWIETMAERDQRNRLRVLPMARFGRPVFRSIRQDGCGSLQADYPYPALAPDSELSNSNHR